MNKLMGFLELKEMKLPSVPWKQYTGKENFEDRYLWTVRSAVYRGNDLNLVSAEIPKEPEGRHRGQDGRQHMYLSLFYLTLQII